MDSMVKVERRRHHYREEVQGIALLHVGIAAFLLDSVTFLQGMGETAPALPPATDLQREIVDRLREGAPLVAVVGGSGDHPAHAADRYSMSRIALSLWERGAIPGALYLNAVCDGVAQSMPGMRMSLWSRSSTATALITQLLGHGYDALIALTSCDKHPLGVLAGAAQWARWQAEHLNEPEPWMVCLPAHVLEGGQVPRELVPEIRLLARKAQNHGHESLAEDLEFNLSQKLQCITVQAFQGAFGRLSQLGLMDEATKDRYERRLGVAASRHTGGTCEFRGTGTTDRLPLVAYGLVPPSVQADPGPPNAEQVNEVVDTFLGLANRPEVGLRHLIHENSLNALYVHAAMSGSTNNMMHMPFVHAYLGYRSSIFDLDAAIRESQVPYMMPGFSLRADQDRGFAGFARQCCSGASGGVDTLMRHLVEAGVPVNLDAPTVSGTWRERIMEGRLPSNQKHSPSEGEGNSLFRIISADEVPESQRILSSTPARDTSGTQVFTGSAIGNSAVLKISGLSRKELVAFEDKIALVVFLAGEDEAADAIGDVAFLEKMGAAFSDERLLAVRRYNSPDLADTDLRGAELYEQMVEERSLRVVVVIGGEGPVSDGMPEVHKPQDWVSKNHRLAPLAYLLTDARFSGTNYGPAFGHAEPEAFLGGIVGYLQAGDPVLVRLDERRMDLVDPAALDEGRGVHPLSLESVAALRNDRAGLYAERMKEWTVRRAAIPPSVRISTQSTTAAEGVVPPEVWEAADRTWDWRRLMEEGRESVQDLSLQETDRVPA
ncbi:MAG: dihydroxy-acid dehydratase [Armatimonadetes bacterium]|nr:dihydroxy-acid dehydratase [Armatimonadota bacterium]